MMREYRFLLSVIGFRNIVIHEYINVNFNLVKGTLSKREYRRLPELALKLRERARIIRIFKLIGT